MTSIPVYIYVPVVLTMLALHLSTVWYAKRRIETLQATLLAKRVLLGRDEIADGSYALTQNAELSIDGYRLRLQSIDCRAMTVRCELRKIT